VTSQLGCNITIGSTPAPELSFEPANATAAEHAAATGTGLTFSADNGNPISVAGADNTSDSLVAYLQVLSGTLTITNPPGPVTVAGNGSSLVSITGTRTAIDDALDGLNYQPQAGITSDVLEGFVIPADGSAPPTQSNWIPIEIDPGSNAK